MRRDVPLRVVRWTGRVVVAVTALAVLWPPAVEWGGRRWGWPVVAATVLVVAVAAALWRQAVYVHHRRRVRVVAAAVGAAATVGGVAVAAVVTHANGIPVAADSVTGVVVLVVVAGILLGYGWSLVATVEEAEPTEAPVSLSHGRPGVGIAVATVVVTVGTLAVAASTTDRSTARPLDGLVARPPADLGREHASFTADGWVHGAGRYLVVDLDGGVEVRDALTGRVRWHFRDSGWSFSRPLVSGDGRTVVVVRPHSERPTAVAFDVATGVRRWSRVLPSDRPVDHATLPRSTAAVGPLIVLFNDDRTLSGTGFAIDARTGEVRWRVPDPPAAACRYDDSVTAPDTVVVAYSCDTPDHPLSWQVVGLSAADGKTRWTERGPDGSTGLSMGIAGRQVHLHRLSRQAVACETVVLDAVSGTTHGRYADTSPGCAPPMVGDGVSAQAWRHGLPGTQVFGIDQRTGEVRWVTEPVTDREDGYVMAHLVVGTTAYVLVQRGTYSREADLAAVDLATGRVSARRVRIPARSVPVTLDCELLPAPGRLVVVCPAAAGNRSEVTILG